MPCSASAPSERTAGTHLLLRPCGWARSSRLRGAGSRTRRALCRAGPGSDRASPLTGDVGAARPADRAGCVRAHRDALPLERARLGRLDRPASDKGGSAAQNGATRSRRAVVSARTAALGRRPERKHRHRRNRRLQRQSSSALRDVSHQDFGRQPHGRATLWGRALVDLRGSPVYATAVFWAPA
jgi:hypothetical protein